MNNGNWRITGASVAGTSHADNDSGCQDRFGWKIIETKHGEILAAVISDGAGSTSDGERGAEIACESLLAELTSFFQATGSDVGSVTREFGSQWLTYFRTRIKEMADGEEKEVREFSSTLVAAVAGHEGTAFFQMGDGGVLHTTKNEAADFRFGIEQEETEYVNMTSFLTDDDAEEQLQYVFLDQTVEDLVLFSDGITNVAIDFSTGKPYEPFLRPMIAPLKENRDTNGLEKKLESFLASPAINEKTDDDKTIILASRTSPHEEQRNQS